MAKQKNRPAPPAQDPDKDGNAGNGQHIRERGAGPGMDPVSAHLDRGWDLLQRGEFSRARISADQVLGYEPTSPEAYTLLGAIAAASGQPEEALGHYRHAMQLDPRFIDPVLYAAETYLWPLENYEEAQRLCEQALDIAEEEDEFLDALLLKAEVELALGEVGTAVATLAELPQDDFPEPVYHLRAARTLLDLEQLEDAEFHFRRAWERDRSLTDALHGLGLCAEERGDKEAMIKAFLEVRKRDLKEPAPPWGVSGERFEEVATEALAALPERLRELLANVPIVAADYPDAELVREGNDPRMLGFFAGVPYPEQSIMSAAPHLSCIYLFQRNVERIARSQEELELEIEKTLAHEAGHFFGLSEEDLEEMGLG